MTRGMQRKCVGVGFGGIFGFLLVFRLVFLSSPLEFRLAWEVVDWVLSSLVGWCCCSCVVDDDDDFDDVDNDVDGSGPAVGTRVFDSFILALLIS